MCGIAGFWSASAGAAETDLRRMINRIASRGPDDSGTWTNQAASIALGHRRLSIIDLSDNAIQPMIDNVTENIVVFNGEIYNINIFESF